MKVVLELPDEIAVALQAEGADLSRAALEGLAIEGYKTHRLTEYQVQRLLGFGSRWHVHRFLKERGVYLDYTMEDFEREMAINRKLRTKRPHDEPKAR